MVTFPSSILSILAYSSDSACPVDTLELGLARERLMRLCAGMERPRLVGAEVGTGLLIPASAFTRFGTINCLGIEGLLATATGDDFTSTAEGELLCNESEMKDESDEFTVNTVFGEWADALVVPPSNTPGAAASPPSGDDADSAYSLASVSAMAPPPRDKRR